MADIFISYSKTDRALALKLSTFLESEGWSVWWDKNLGAADHYRDEIMKQLVAARAVITIWSPNSIQSDWVRAEAGRAKADGKLIPVKTSELTYADIPLPFGEMHIENVTSTELIRAAIVAQLSKPALPQAPFWQITRMFESQVLTWVGIVGTAITVFANLQGVLDLADWARELVKHWHEWNQIIWGWVFTLVGIKLPREVAPLYSFSLFTSMLVVGINLAERRANTFQKRSQRPFIVGIFLYMGIFFAVLMTVGFSGVVTPSTFVNVAIVLFIVVACGFPSGYLLYVVKERRLLVLVASALFFFMTMSLVFAPLHNQPYTLEVIIIMFLAMGLAFPILWMMVILTTPLQRLTRRLGFVVLGVLTLVVLNEISQLNLHQYIKPPKASEHSGVSLAETHCCVAPTASPSNCLACFSMNIASADRSN
jgi:hypothetical protein